MLKLVWVAVHRTHVAITRITSYCLVAAQPSAIRTKGVPLGWALHTCRTTCAQHHSLGRLQPLWVHVMFQSVMLLHL
jgi:hypothetical protein